jgi:hypothetical protein
MLPSLHLAPLPSLPFLPSLPLFKEAFEYKMTTDGS